ncbi:YjbF family lipoprotein [Actibacterium sp. MT2.3-13A]|uniref:YjbF family lipoprotein n=1 Tax=Actibacterium sp. MT2.3-13A TaxID=2828332 RepID=UPI001BA7CEF4|nr:YjbF family lipoprotein [Actibacterium sp. MT2.3-13A]
MRQLRTAGLVLAALLGLSGCGSDPAVGDNPLLLGVSALRDGVRTRAAGDAPAPALTRAMVDQVQVPLILASLESRGVTGALVPIGQNGADTTWGTADQIAVIMRGDVVRGTRGLGEDLMSASIPGESVLRSANSVTQREYFHLDGDDQTVRRKFSCEIHEQDAAALVIVERRYQARHFEERCSGQNGGFTNEYWFLADGRMIQSRQWISPSVGFMKLQRLKP